MLLVFIILQLSYTVTRNELALLTHSFYNDLLETSPHASIVLQFYLGFKVVD